MDGEGEASDVVHPPVKAPLTRLLDMMAGWADFIQRDGVPDADGVVDTVCDLYQQAGNLELDDCADDPETVAILRAFLLDRVLPVLLRA